MTPHEAALELEWVASDYMLRWLRRMSDVTVTAFGRAEGACCPEFADADFLNTVHRLLPDEAELVPHIVEHCVAVGVGPWFELMPAPGFEGLADALHAAGARQVGFLTMQERELPAPPPAELPAGVAITPSADDPDAFARVLPEGHGVPADRLEQAVARTREQAAIERTRTYLARVDGVPAAAAVLYLSGDVAYLANASTLERYRRRGCQGALVQRRLADAAAAGCRRACVITGWGNQSHANMVRAGFRSAYTKAMWRMDRPG